jgi:Ca2+/H+ antiporter, TMEM165/GDT1 family
VLVRLPIARGKRALISTKRERLTSTALTVAWRNTAEGAAEWTSRRETLTPSNLSAATVVGRDHLSVPGSALTKIKAFSSSVRPNDSCAWRRTCYCWVAFRRETSVVGFNFAARAFATTYVAVLAAETIGDRSAYTVGALSARFGSRRVLRGVVPAFMLKALAAVLLGDVLKRLPTQAVTALTAVTFLTTALLLWRDRARQPAFEAAAGSARAGVATAFGAIFFSEWADRGQLVTAVMAGQAPGFLVWSASVLALCTKATVVSVAGARLGEHMARPRWRAASVSLFLAMSLLALLRFD